MTASPLVTIAIPTHNHARVIGDAIRSAQNQTYSNIKILVIDNASEDDTRAVVERIAGGDSRLRYLRNDTNVGMTGNFNACIASAHGEYIKFLCADDLLLPDCVSAMVEAIANHPDVALVACARLLVDDQLADLGEARYSARSVEVAGTSVIHRCFFRGNLIGEPTAVMFRKNDARRGFRNEYRQLMDLEMWMYLMGSGSMRYLAKPLCKVRQHPLQATQKNLKSGIVLEEKRRMFRELHATMANVALTDKLSWDIRMAVTLIRTRQAGCAVVGKVSEDVYFCRIFGWMTLPAAWVLWQFVLRFRA